MMENLWQLRVKDKEQQLDGIENRKPQQIPKLMYVPCQVLDVSIVWLP